MAGKKLAQIKEDVPKIEKEESTTISPFVFISHDSRDAELAKAFGELLKKASTGVIKYFCSSDRSGKEGIEYGSEWYPTIIENVEKASDVVCLLTDRSVNRPWLLYEAGMAKGKKDCKVLGLVLGIDMKVATEGPFAQFQNCLDDKDALVKLLIQLVGRIPNAEPNDKVIAIFVDEFITAEKNILKAFKTETKKEKKEIESNSELNSSAKLFEEIKLMFKELSIKSNKDYSRFNDRKWNENKILFEHFYQRRFSPRIIARMGFYFYKESMSWVYEEGNFLLNQLLDGKNDSDDIMRQTYELLDTTRNIQTPLFDSFREYDMANHIILEAMEYIARDCEKKRKNCLREKQTRNKSV